MLWSDHKLQVLQNADAIGCRKYLTPSALVAGNPRLNLAFVANLFNNYPGLEPLDEQEAKDRVWILIMCVSLLLVLLLSSVRTREGCVCAGRAVKLTTLCDPAR